MLLMIYCLEPPYTKLVPWAGRLPALGSVLASDLLSADRVSREIAEAASSAPWCPIVLLSGPGPFCFAVLETVLGLVVKVTLVARTIEAPAESIKVILDAVRRRCKPTSLDLGQYVIQRIGFARLLPTLVMCLDLDESGLRNPTLVRSTINRRLKQAGELSAHDWTALGRVIRAMQAPRGCVDELACDHGMDPRTLRAHLQRYAAVSVGEARERVGWEWLLESVLRVWGYLPALARLQGPRR